MHLELDPALKAALPENADSFEWFLGAQGVAHREVKHRLTYETHLGEHHIFVKRHIGCGWGEVFKEWYRLRKPVVSARTEWEGAAILEKAGLRVPRVLGEGERGSYPHAVESFVVLEALEDCETLEHFKEGWLGFEGRVWVDLKRSLIREVARMCHTMHGCGINHRDLYINHFLISRSQVKTFAQDGLPPLYLIDLHRVQQRQTVPSRWLQKDLSALFFSALDVGLTSTDCIRFLKEYLGPDWKSELRNRYKLWNRIIKQAIRLYRDFYGKPPTVPQCLV